MVHQNATGDYRDETLETVDSKELNNINNYGYAGLTNSQVTPSRSDLSSLSQSRFGRGSP